MFSGQGSQYYQMGKDLFDAHPVYQQVVRHGESVARDLIHDSIIDSLFSFSPTDLFDNLLLSHPAIVITEYAMYQTLLSEGIEPDYVWGSSIGEFAAAIISGVWSYETALEASIEQSKCIISNCSEGCMLAVLAPIKIYTDSSKLKKYCSLAGINFPNHFTISFRSAYLSKIESYLNERNISYQKLPVNYGFHSEAIDEAKGTFDFFCSTLQQFNNPNIPIFSSFNTKQIHKLHQDHFWRAVREPIHFQETLNNIEKDQSCFYIDCGPSGTLSTFVKYNLSLDSASKHFPILTPFNQGIRNLKKIKKALTV